MARRRNSTNSSNKSKGNNTSSKDKVVNRNENDGSSSTNASKDEVPGDSRQGNDPAWYARDPYLLRDVGSYAFGYAWGKQYDLPVDTIYDQGSVISGCNVSPAGIFVLRTKPTMGASHTATSALNTAAASLYAYVRHLNSGRKNYEPADLFLYLTAIANLYSYIIFCERLYSFGMTYSDQNRYIPTALIQACGVSPDSLIRNLSNFRAWLDTFINRVSVFAVPADITYFNKTTFMYRDVYIENGDGNIKDQMYMYVPDGFYKYNLDADSIGMLDYKFYDKNPASSSPYTVSNLQDFGEDLLSALFEDEDASLMSGDLFKVYQSNIIRLPSCEEFIALPLVYDPMILWQIKNTVVAPLIRMGNNESSATTPNDRRNIIASTWSLGTGRTQLARPGCVFQDIHGLLISMERYINNDNAIYALDIPTMARIGVGKILSSELAHPGPEIVIESSRGIIGPTETPDSSMNDKGWITCGTFVAQVGYYMKWEDGNVSFSVTQFQNVANLAGAVQTAHMDLANQFKYSPIMYGYTWNSGNSAITLFTPISDVNNYVILERHNLDKLHDCALLSLFYVPGIAKI